MREADEQAAASGRGANHALTISEMNARKAIDPVCGMEVDPATALHAERGGRTFYFCCAHCREKFLAQPASQYRTGTDLLKHSFREVPAKAPQKVSESCCHGQESGEAVQPSSSANFYCPMCHGGESDKPGDCPKCGMALEAATPSVSAAKIIYTCPMHPEVQQDQPGDCPKCGMALEPKEITTDTE